MINHTQVLLRKLSDGEFQQLASELLQRFNKKYDDIVHTGAAEGTAKTRAGSPDIGVKKSNHNSICVEVTTDSQKG